MAGVMGAKDGEACGLEDSDTCGVSLYKVSPTCSLGGGLPWGAPPRGDPRAWVRGLFLWQRTSSASVATYSFTKYALSTRVRQALL